MKTLLVFSAILALAIADQYTVYDNCNNGSKVCYGSTSSEDGDDPITIDNPCFAAMVMLLSYKPLFLQN